MTLHSYFCTCSEILIILSSPIEDFPRRELDDAVIVPTTSIAHGTYHDSGSIIIDRKDGYEDRSLKKCKRCDLDVAYQLDDITEWTFLLKDAMTKELD